MPRQIQAASSPHYRFEKRERRSAAFMLVVGGLSTCKLEVT